MSVVTPKNALIALLVAGALILDYLLLTHFNTLVWPYLWPRPGIFIILGLLALVLWIPEWFSGAQAIRLVGLAMVFIGQCYLLHSFQVMLSDFSVLSLLHFLGIFGTFSVMTLNYFNQATPKAVVNPPRLPRKLPYVAVVVPTYGEPVDILENTVISIKGLEYPADRLHIVISDDGHRDEVRAMAERQGIHYHPGAQKDAKAGNLNSALDYLRRKFPQGTLVVTQDADEVIHPSFLQKTVGYFKDPEIAFVQTPKEAIAPPGDPFGVRDRVFYDTIQPGRNGSNSAFSCGSGVIWRIAAVRSIGGFATWNIVEDLTTSYFLHSAGYRSAYHNEVLTIGLAPDDIPGLLKQRGTWATDTWRLFLFNNPITRPGLTLRQRLQYTELGLFYVTSAFFMPLIMLVPPLALLTGRFVPIEGSALFPWLAISVLYYTVLTHGKLDYLKNMWQYWVSHCPTYFKAFLIAVRSKNKKPSYKVTRKTRQDGFYGKAIWPQFLYLIIGTAAIMHGWFGMPTVSRGVRLTNIALLLFFMFLVSAICQAAFYGVKLSSFVRLPQWRWNWLPRRAMRSVAPSGSGD
jgi:cellulose synthase (UDP-forming)